MSEIKRYTSAIPPLHTVEDQNVRRVLEALVSGWRTRNGDLKPDSDERFITKGELRSLVEKANFGYFAPGAPGNSLLKDAVGKDALDIERIIRQVEESVLSSQLFSDLGERIQGIDLRLIDEQIQRAQSVRQVADDLTAEAETRLGFDNVVGSRVETLEEVTDDQALLISGLTTRVSGAESTIVNLQETTATQAKSLVSITTRVGDSESSIRNLDETTATQATSLESLTTRVGDNESAIIRLDKTTADQASTLEVLSVKSGENESSIIRESEARTNADNAITETFEAQISQLDDNLAAVTSTTNTLVTDVAAVSRSVQTLRSSVDDNTTAIQIEADARVTADNGINSKYSVKIDSNGYVSGFGLISTANNSVPTSDFIVRADRFAIGSPSGPGVPAKVPFTVQTTATTGPDGAVIPAGVYMDSTVVRELRGAYIYGSYIQAGTLEAAIIKSGSALYDTESGQELNAVASSGTGPNDTYIAAVSTWSALRFYGSNFHSSVPINQRLRSTGDRGAITFLVSASSVAEHFLSIWYRVVDPSLPQPTRPLGDPSIWTPLGVAVEPQRAYGSAALSCVARLSISANTYVEFGIAPLNVDGQPNSYGALGLYTSFVSVIAVNL